VTFIAHPRRRHRANGARREQAAPQIEDLALAILGGLTEQDDRARLDQLGGVAQRCRAADFRKQRDLVAGIGVAVEHAVEEPAQQRIFGRAAIGTHVLVSGQSMAAPVTAVMRLDGGRSVGGKTNKTGRAIYSGRPPFEEARIGGERGAFIEDGVDTPLAELYI